MKQGKRPQPDYEIKREILMNACSYFKVNLSDLLKDTMCTSLVSKIVLCALYYEADFTYKRAADVFNCPYSDYVPRAIRLIVKYMDEKHPDAGIILSFYQKHGYCSFLCDKKEKAA